VDQSVDVTERTNKNNEKVRFFNAVAECRLWDHKLDEDI
jgi:hypothetical protein